MSGAGFILAINLCMAGLVAGVFAALGARSDRTRAPFWFAASYGLGVVHLLVEAVIAAAGSNLILVVLSFATVLAAMGVFAAGLSIHYRSRPPWRLIGTLFFLSIVACFAIQELPRTSFWRMAAYQTPFALMQAVAAGIAFKAGFGTVMGKAMTGLLSLSALQFLSKPFLMTSMGGTGATAGDYLRTDYALASQSLGTVFALAIAILTLAMLVQQVLSEVTERSETDALSGLLNRSGFQRHASAAMDGSARVGLPVALVIADLDHFKAVNDTFGHASGDQVIATFASLLRSAAGGHNIAARLGGEEFAIVLPGTNLAAARLFAEGARSAFSGLSVDGLPEDRRFTASFGVAERLPEETFEALMRRADLALYAAKTGGRDRVTIADGIVPSDEVSQRHAG